MKHQLIVSRRLALSLLALASVFLTTTPLAKAGLPPPPITTGDLLTESAFTASSWKLGDESTLTSNGINTVSDETNPVYVYQKNFPGDILVQCRLKNVHDNHNVNVIISSRLAVSFMKAASGAARMMIVTLDKMGRPETPALFECVLSEQPVSKTMPDDFVLSLALRGQKATAWIDTLEIAEVTVPGGLPAFKRVSFRSGWKSDWTLADFAIRQLRAGK